VSSQSEGERLRDLFGQALDLPAAERAVFLRDSCGNDRTLHAKLLRLIRAHQSLVTSGDTSPRSIDPEMRGDPLASTEFVSRLSPGFSFGARYEVIAFVGRGGMGEVYRARDTRLRRDVAIKILRRELAGDAARRQRFEHEAQATALLGHPNVVSVFDFGDEDGAVYLVTEFVVGETLRAHLRRKPADLRTAVNWGTQLAAGLAAAHEKGIVHRDLKPENILITVDNRLKILDFGIAKLTAQFWARFSGGDFPETVGRVGDETVAGTLLGTPRYMAPEQLDGSWDGAPSDVFSFGLVLHEMLTGAPLFGQTNAGEVIDAVKAFRKYSPPRGVRGRSQRLTRLISRCLNKRPSARPDASALGAELKRMSITRGVRRARSAITPHTTKSPAVLREARQAWARARFLLDHQLDNWCEESFTELQKAIELSPSFALPRVDLSQWYAQAATRGEISYEDGLLQAVRQAEHAVQLEPTCVDARCALARAYYLGRRYNEAERILSPIVDTNPSNVQALIAYSELLSVVGRHGPALVMADRAVDHGRLNTSAHSRKAAALFSARAFQQCLDHAHKSLALSPTSSELHYIVGQALLVLQEPDEALVHLSRALKLKPRVPYAEAAVVIALKRTGRQAESTGFLRRLEEQGVDPVILAEAYAGVGRMGDALSCLEMAFRRDSPYMMDIPMKPVFDPLSDHPRFQRLKRAILQFASGGLQGSS
jgi:serine/threonine protein kinase/Flp pilus assembly protein TadD